MILFFRVIFIKRLKYLSVFKTSYVTSIEQGRGLLNNCIFICNLDDVITSRRYSRLKFDETYNFGLVAFLRGDLLPEFL